MSLFAISLWKFKKIVTASTLETVLVCSSTFIENAGEGCVFWS